jgi:hypothetical protein
MDVIVCEISPITIVSTSVHDAFGDDLVSDATLVCGHLEICKGIHVLLCRVVPKMVHTSPGCDGIGVGLRIPAEVVQVLAEAR